MSNTDPQHPEGADTSAVQAALEVEELERQSATAARLFDLRRIIGGLFVVYGIIVGAMGISPSDADMKKSQDININLWTGLAMLLLGLFFLLWQHFRPVVPPSAEELAAAAERPDVH